MTMSFHQLEMLLDSVDVDTGLVRLVWRREDFEEDGDFYIQKEFRLMPGQEPARSQEEE
jgi:hypothetical protein